MIVYVRKWIQRTRFVLTFVVLTYAMYHLVSFIADWMEPAYRYREPTGRAVKVFQAEHLAEPERTFMDRLRIFYWYGG